MRLIIAGSRTFKFYPMIEFKAIHSNNKYEHIFLNYSKECFNDKFTLIWFKFNNFSKTERQNIVHNLKDSALPYDFDKSNNEIINLQYAKNEK